MKQRRYSHAGALVAFLVGLSAWLVPASPAAAAGTLAVNRTTVDFGNQRVGTFGDVERVTLTASGEPVTVSDVFLDGGNALLDFLGVVTDETDTYCYDIDGDANDDDLVLAAGESCVVDIVFLPGERGLRNAVLSFEADASNSPTTNVRGIGTTGYYIAGTLGQVANFGDADDLGDVSATRLNQPIVGMSTTPNGEGFWLVARDGGIFSFGNAAFRGSTGGMRLNQPIVGMAASPDGQGYWLVASDGGIFSFGTPFFGSMGGKPLNQPIVGMAATPTGQGYWLVARDGGIFTFGDAGFFDSMGGRPLNLPMIAMAPTPTGAGYHTLALDGGMFSFGDAEFHGSMGGKPLNAPMVGMAQYPTGHGYWTVAADGGIFTFGNAPFHGSLGGQGIDDVITMAGTATPGLAGLFGIAAAADDGRVSVRPQQLPANRKAVG